MADKAAQGREGSADHMSFSYGPGLQRPMRIFHTERGLAAYPVMATAEAVFQLEKEVRDRRIDAVEIGLRAGVVAKPTMNIISATLTQLVSYILIEEVAFHFKRLPPLRPKRIRTDFDLKPASAICLFSGGLDSVVGIALAASRIADVNAVFCAHSDQAHAIKTVEDLAKGALSQLSVPLRKVYVSPIQKRGYAQTRGFLYALMGAAWMQLLQSSQLIITEVGPTMYQPKFAPLDTVTFTTHPMVVRTARVVAEELLQRPLDIVTPFEDLTKAEVFAVAPAGLPLHKTHSCISQRFGDHDGTCYGCIVRRLAGIAAGRRDVYYKRNPILDRSANRGNLVALLRFNRDCLWNIDQMEEYEVGDIIRYGKKDLFRRFALDNFAALHSMIKAGESVVDDVMGLYESARSVIGSVLPLESRLERLSSGAFRANF